MTVERVDKNVIDRAFSDPRGLEVWNGHCEWVVDGRVDLDRLRTAAASVVAEHPMLGARDGGDGTWVLGGSPPPRLVEVHDVADEAALVATLGRAVSRAFDLRVEPPVRFDLVRAPERDHVVAVADHAVVDGVGVGRTVASLIRSYVSGGSAPADEGWRCAHPLHVGASSGEQDAAVEERLRDWAMPTAVRLAREHVRAVTGQGVAYHELSGPATDALGARRRSEVGTRNDVVVAAFCVAGMMWNRQHGQAVVPFTVGVPVNLRPPRAWLEGVCNATLPWTVRIADDDLEGVLPRVVDQLRTVRAGAYSPAVRDTLAYVDRRRGPLPLRVRHALATSTVVSTVPGAGSALSETSLRRVVMEVRGGAPVPGPLGMAFTVVPGFGPWTLSARYLRSHHTAEGAQRFLSLVDDAVVQLTNLMNAQREVA